MVATAMPMPSFRVVVLLLVLLNLSFVFWRRISSEVVSVSHKTSHVVTQNSYTEHSGRTVEFQVPEKHSDPPRTRHIPLNLTFLHIPKTGTSIKLQMVQYLCNTTSQEEAEALVNLHANPDNAKRLGLTEESPNYRCGLSIGLGHDPLHTPPEDTIVMIRHPFQRIASGLVHDFHDCPRWIQEPMDSRGFCKQLSKGLRNDNVTQLSHIIYDYARCVSGCGTNMLAGRRCAERPPIPFGASLTTVLESFAFVGHTDEWERSLCSFRRQFPRLNGAPYDTSNRTFYLQRGRFKKCQQDIVTILNEAPESELLLNGTYLDPDWELYRTGLELFHQRLPSECE